MSYARCKLSTIVSPGEYIVLSEDKNHLDEVREIEKCLTEDVTWNYSVPNFEYSPLMWVVVDLESGTQLRRGVIEKKLEGNKFGIFLVDYGYQIQAEKSNIRLIINKEYTEVEPLSFKVRLHGLLPTKPDIINGEVKKRFSQKWSTDAKSFVKKLFKNNQKLAAQSVMILERTVLGDLFLKLIGSSKYVSLRKLLLSQDFCTYSESQFLKLEGLGSPLNCSDSEMKMKAVEKWQREHFEVFQSLSFDSTSQISREKCQEDCESTRVSNSEGLACVDLTHEEKLLIDNQDEKLSADSTDIFAEPCNGEKPLSDVGAGRGELLRKILKTRKKPLSGKGAGRGELLCKFLKRSEKPEREETVGKYVCLSEENLKNSNADDSPSSGKSTSAVQSIPLAQSTPFSAPSVKVGYGRGKILEKILATRKVETVGEPGGSQFKDDLKECISLDSSPSDCNQLNLTDESHIQKEATTVEKEESAKTKSSRLSRSDSSDAENSNSDGWEKSRLEDFSLPKTRKLPSRLKGFKYWTPLVLFEDSAVEPVNTFRELPIKANIIRNLEKGGRFNELSPLQRWTIPSIRKQHNVVMIGSPKTGKTLSYVISIMDYIQEGSYFEELPEGNGPCVVIACSSSRVCESVYYLCHGLLGNDSEMQRKRSKVKIVLAHGGGLEERVWVNLTNGCDILISTPPCLVRLLEIPVITNFERLTCLVFDEVDVICQDPFSHSVRVILEKAKHSARGHHHQKIFIGEKWIPGVESLVKTYFKSRALIIGSYVEAAIYQKIKPRVFLVDRNEKTELLLGILKEMEATNSLIICESPAETVSAHDFFADRNVDSLVAHENMAADELTETLNIWKSSTPQPLLIATDGVLGELNVKDVRTLVHFGLPSKSKTNFFLRYSVFKNFNPNQENGKATCLQNVLLIDDENHYQLPHIVDFMVRLGGKISSEILSKCEEIRREIEIGREGSSICQNLLSFGTCRNSNVCPRRHAFVKNLDCPGKLPSRGWVNFVVVKVHDASCFSVRLTGHVDVDGETSKIDDDSVRVSMKLSDYFGVKVNRRPHGVPKVGDICAVRVESLDQETFHRAEVIEFVSVDKYDRPLVVNVRLIDRGDILKLKNLELYELPEELVEHPPLAVEVRLVGVQPLDFDVAWSEVANSFVEGLLSRDLKENEYWSGKVALVLKGTLFLETVMLKRFLSSVNAHVFEIVVQKELLKHKIATKCSNHMVPLYKLCGEADIGGGETEDSSPQLCQKANSEFESETQGEAEWAFFEKDILRVRFLSAENTSTIFLQPKKFQSLLEDLEACCEEEGAETKKEIERRKIKGLGGPKFAVGMFVLARFEDCWNRGRIEQENEDSFYVFFVDHGDFLFVPKTDVIPISKTLVSRLPFQAIECELVGLKHGKECSTEVLVKIYEFSDNGASDLFVRVVEKKSKAEITGGRKYVLNVMSPSGKSLNKELAEEGMMDIVEAEKKHMEDMELRLEEKEEAGEGKRNFSSGDTEKETTEPYFSLLSDDLFEDEDGQEFMKEFVDRFLSGISPSTAPDQPSQTVSPDPKHEIKQDKSVWAEKTTMASKKQKMNSVANLKTRENILTPKITWCQNPSEVQIKVMLETVEDFKLDCSVRNVLFRCRVRDKQYAVDLRLFGAICPELTQTTTKAFYVVLNLKKLTNFSWPRLQADTGRQWWISWDVGDAEEERDGSSELIESVKRDLEAGHVKERKRNETIYPYSESEDEDLDSDSEVSE